MNAPLVVPALVLAATASFLAAGAGYAVRRARLSAIAGSCTNVIKYIPLVEKWAWYYDVPAEWVVATIVIESCGNPNLRGDTRQQSYGLMQLNTEAHGARIKQRGYALNDLFNPNVNIMFGVEYMRAMIDMIKATTPKPPIDLNVLVRQAYKGHAPVISALKAGTNPVVYPGPVGTWNQTLARGRALV